MKEIAQQLEMRSVLHTLEDPHSLRRSNNSRPWRVALTRLEQAFKNIEKRFDRMKTLFLHGWQSVPGGVKPTYLKDHGHEVINPKLPDEDFEEAVRIAQREFDKHQPQVVVGSSRGGAVAMNMNSAGAKLVLLCPAWKKYGAAKTVKPSTVILHSRADDVVSFADSEELAEKSGAKLIEVGSDHRLADPEPLQKMLEACGTCSDALKIGDVVRAVVRKTAAFGLFCESGAHEILVLIPEISWIPSFASCEQVAAVGDELEVKIIHVDKERNKIAGSIRAMYPENDPWSEAWQFGVGDVLEATVVRWVEKADRCAGAGGYLLALRPAALVMLCGQATGRFNRGERVEVTVTSIDKVQGQVKVELRT